MPNEKTTCRIAIQMCVGCFPDGRERHRTFTLRHVRTDVPFETVLELARALAPVIAFPITKVSKITKTVLFSAEAERGAEHAVPRPSVPTPRAETGPVPETVPEGGQIIPFPVFPVSEPPAMRAAIGYDIAEPSCSAAGQNGFMPGRAPPARSPTIRHTQ